MPRIFIKDNNIFNDGINYYSEPIFVKKIKRSRKSKSKHIKPRLINACNPLLKSRIRK